MPHGWGLEALPYLWGRNSDLINTEVIQTYLAYALGHTTTGLKPQSVIRYDANGLLHKNTMLYDVIFLMTVMRKATIWFMIACFIQRVYCVFPLQIIEFGSRDLNKRERIYTSAKCPIWVQTPLTVHYSSSTSLILLQYRG